MDASGVIADLHQGFVFLLESFLQLKHNKTSHDFSNAGNFSSFLLVFTEHQSRSLLVENSPRLSTTVRSRLVHQNLGQLDFLSWDVRFRYYQLAVLTDFWLVIFSRN